MASTYFYYTPTTGTGNAQVTVSAASVNSTTTDKSATISIANGVSTATVNVIQYYKPYKMQGPTSIPATGGSITLTAMSHYDIVFRSVPLWLTIWSGNTQIQEGERISLAPNTSGVFTLSAGTNDGDERTTQYAGMNMSHYIGDTLNTLGAPIIECTQAAYVPPTPTVQTKTVDVATTLNYLDEGYVTFDLSASSYNSYVTHTAFTLDTSITRNNSGLEIKYLSDGSSTVEFKLEMWYVDGQGMGQTRDFNVTVGYGSQTQSDNVTSGEKAVFTFTYDSSNSATITIYPAD